ncbi:hypothetical protein D7X74_09955 [Corallococcus sp. CA047B]|uniref:cyclophilin-like fold protein n=1 Tax=Corallococcus sp. CA047B TaxID=2316729 RepID=UPI000EA358CE|nr:cyclophilin-like fold protein [Corallococcus sp. CA047B]RKH18303.1 hypothetical protein D7X74_09955 [Corallococcus sp. CA047B]
MHIKFTIDGATVEAVLEDNPTARDFASMLPMTAKFEDFHSTEKISYLSRKLSTEGATADYEANVWDITYYVPWGNLAIFYREYRPSRDLIKLGRITTGREALLRSSSFTATIESVEK